MHDVELERGALAGWTLCFRKQELTFPSLPTWHTTAGYSVREAQEQREREQEKAWEKEGAEAAAAARQHERPPAEPVELTTFVRIHLPETHSDLRGVRWYYEKKASCWPSLAFGGDRMRTHLSNPCLLSPPRTQTGLVKEHDRGLADIRIYGKGMDVELDVEPGLPVATPEKPIGHTIGALCRRLINRSTPAF